jgi:hypothetical protein
LQLAARFIAELLVLAAEAAAAGSAVVFAGVYPHAWYKPHHLPALRRVGCGALDVL